MGLLDAFDSPQMALAAGLLGGGSFGQALGRGMAGSQAVQLAEQRRREMEAQSEERRAMAEQRQAQAQQLQAQMAQQRRNQLAVRNQLIGQPGMEPQKFDPRAFLMNNPDADMSALEQAIKYNGMLNPAKKYETLAPGSSMVEMTDAGPRTAFTAPKEKNPNQPFMYDEKGNMVPNRAYQEYEMGKSRAGATSVQVNTDNLGLKPKDRFDMEKTLRSDYNAATDMDRALMDTAQNITGILKQGGPLKDQAAIYTFAKALDPKGAVREADYAAIVATAGGLDYVTNLVNKAMSGEQLSVKQRKEMDSLAASMANVAKTRVDKQKKRYGGNAQMYNLKPENIFDQEEQPTAVAPKPVAKQAPSAAVNMLKMNPRLAADYDAKYGEGAAAEVLGR